MKIIITENKLFNSIYRYIDIMIDTNDINWVYGPNEDYPENENFLIFYKGGTWAGEDYSDIVFNYFTVDYYGDEPSNNPFKNSAPILDVMDEYGLELDKMFGNKHWRGPMKKWFEDKFNLPVKTINTWY